MGFVMQRRMAQLVGGGALAALLVYVFWPRPAVNIRVTAEGVAFVHGVFGRVSVLPDTIVVSAGGRPKVRITNADTITHRLGLFAAPAGQVVEYTLPQPGTYTGLCSAHPTSNTLTYVVR
jgi:plastocyanin